MRESMPEISFERSMNHNYMILSKCSFFGGSEDKGNDYRAKMLLENRIPGLLPVTHRLINGESRYYYEINSLQSLDRLYDKTEVRYDELRRLLSGCVSLFDRLEEYLLDGTQIIIKPELIYIDVERMEPYFVCYPDYEGDVRLSFMEFIDELLTRIDHTDERAVMLGYQIYRYTRNPNYVISEIGNMMEHVIVNMANREGTIAQNRLEPSGNDGFGLQYDSERDVHKIDAHGRVSSQKDYVETQKQFETDSYEETEEEAEGEESLTRQPGRRTKSIGDLIGGIFCIFVSLCSGAIILGARILHSFQLSGNSELYLYGAMGMAIVAAVLFFSCYLKKRRKDRETELADDDEDCEDIQYYTAAGSSCDSHWYDDNKPKSPVRNEDQGGIVRALGSTQYEIQRNKCSRQREHSETVYLGESVVEERMLCGRMNGKEINISLERLPMTVGKQANVSDFVIDDTAVSKMHARFEEHDGRVYVRDLNSTNGTVRNGELLAVNQSVALEPGDRLRFGRTSFTYC
ncbi:MAG: FHA domain-containing protein [Lachnospiraceae bacterium]|nr:FHA domain-containing protein [Lachnospiraceae bacterium]